MSKNIIPEEIRRHRLPGTEIKIVGKNYYLYRVTCKWDKEAKKYRKINLGYIGKVTPDGIIDARHRNERKVLPITASYSLEYGASWVLRQGDDQLLEVLKRHFPIDAEWIYVLALLRAAKHCAFKYIEHFYNVSFLSKSFPDLPFSPATISGRMTQIGSQRKNIVSFMKEYIPSEKFYAIFDGTSIICNSQNISYAQRGYNSHGCHDPQINLMYALAANGESITPVFYKKYPGSIRDVSAFRDMMREMNIGKAVILADKGFYSDANGKELEHLDIPYIMPLRRNSLEYERTPLFLPGTTGFQGRFKYNGRIVWHWTQPAAKDSACRYFLFLDETLKYTEMNSRMTGKIGEESFDDLKKIQQAQLLFGTIVLKTTLPDIDAEQTYKLYKTREDIEQLFDIYKDEENFETTGMHSPETMEATLFLNHLSTLMIYKLYEKLRTNDKLDKYAATKVCDCLWDVRISKCGNDWHIEPIPKMARQLFQALGMEPPMTLK